MKVLLSLALIVILTGCAGTRLRVGPLGSGFALPEEGPGVEFALSGGDGKVTTGGRLAAELPDWLAPIWDAVRSFLPSIDYTIAGKGVETPTGPEPAPEPPGPDQ